MKTKVFIVAVVSLLFALIPLSFGQKVKVLDKSSRKAPDWIGGIEKNYIIVSSEGESLDAAQSNALLKIKERIIASIAENIQTQSEYYRGEKNVNGVTTFIENYEVSTKTKAADIGFIKGISLNKAETYYWEKVLESGKIRFHYHIKYPFSEHELAKLILDFNMADRQLTEEMNEIIDSIPFVSSLEKINEYILSLQNLSKAFIDQRRQKAEINILKLSEMLKSISIHTTYEKLGEIRYLLKLGERIITTGILPRVSSNCAKITSVNSQGYEWVIRYDYSGCYDDVSNAIIVNYAISPAIKKSFYFDVNAEKAEIIIRGDIIFTAQDMASQLLNNVKCDINLYSKYSSPFIIENIILQWENHLPVVIEGIKKEFKGKGEHKLSVIIPQSLETTKCSAKTKNVLGGTIQFRTVTGELKSYTFYNQSFKSNW